MDTVNKITGLEIDHFMMADFNAVKELSNAVGGVEVCISDAVYDPDSRLRLPAGNSQVQGEQALAFLRTRHAFADGGDLGRIKAQQGFLSSLTRKIKDDGTLSNPAEDAEDRRRRDAEPHRGRRTGVGPVAADHRQPAQKH